MNMVERVARAIAEADGEDYMEDHQRYDARAVAAIKAIRPTERHKDVYVIIDQATGDVHGTRFYLSEEHAVRSIQDRGFGWDPDVNFVAPATLLYRSDR